MSVDQQTLALELMSNHGVSRDAAFLVARAQKVRPEVGRRLRLEHARDARSADDIATQREAMQRGALAPDAQPSAATTRRVIEAADILVSRRLAAQASMASAAALNAPGGTETPAPTSSYVRPVQVIIAEGPDRGGAHDQGGVRFRNVEYAGKWAGRVLRTETEQGQAAVPYAELASGGPAAPADTPAPNAAPATTRPHRSVNGDPSIMAADALSVASVALGVLNPAAAIGLAVVHRVAARADMSL